MIKNYLLLFLCFTTAFTTAQKVDLDKAKFNVKYQILPRENVPFEKRTYTVTSTTGPTIRTYKDQDAVNREIRLDGWKLVENDGTVNINLDLIEFSLISSRLQEEVTENKDKAGKVISRTVRYFVKAEFKQDGRVKITGPFSPKELTQKELEAQKQKEEKIATNRFLAKTNLNSNAANEANSRIEYLPNTRTYTTDMYETSAKAVDYFKVSQESIRENLLRNFVQDAIDRAYYSANYHFGFAQASDNTDFLWILDTKSHPEYQAQQEAIQAVKELFNTMKANESIDALEENLGPLLEYFESLKTKYKSDDKTDKKIRYGAFYNLAKIYHYLDKPALAIIQANGLIDNDYDTKDGERLREDAQALLDTFKKTKFNSRHNIAFK